MTLTGSGGVIGRGRELARMQSLLTDHDGAHRGIALIGPAGAGKSSLAHAAREMAEAAGYAIVSAAATPVSARLTLGALSHLLPPAGELATVHDDLQPAQLLQAATATLHELAEGLPLFLMIDDAHHLDAVSAHLVHQLSVSGVVFTMLTVRSGEPVESPITALWKDGVVDRIDVGPLGADDTVAIAAQVLGGLPDADAADWLYRTSGGNALYVRELAAGAAEHGALREANGRWRLEGTGGRVSPRLADLVEQRLIGLTSEQRRALDLVAFAEPIGLDLAQQTVGETALYQLDDLGLLTVTTAGYRAELRPSHPLFGEALRQQPMSLRRRADLQALIAAVTALGARRRDDPVRIASWQLAAGGTPDPMVLLRAAIAAQIGFDDQTAVRLASTAIAQQPAELQLRTELHLTLATSLGRLGRFPEGDAALASLRDAPLTDAQRARIAMRRVMMLAEGADDPEAAETVGRSDLAALHGSEWADDVRCVLATMQADFGRITAASATLAELPAPPLLPRSASAHLLATTAILQGQARWDDCAASADAGYRFQLLHRDEDATFHPMSQYIYRFTAFTRCGRLDDAAAGIEQIRAAFTDAPRPVGNVVVRLMAGRVHFARGEFADALALFDDADARLAPWMQPYLHRWTRSLISWTNAVTGATSPGSLPSGPADAGDPREARRAGVGFGGSDVACGTTAALLAGQHRAAAERCLRTAIQAATAQGDLGSLGDLLQAACLMGVNQPAAARQLRDLVAATPPSPISAAHAALAAAALGDDGAWGDAAQAFAELDMVYFGAQAAANGAVAARDGGRSRPAAALANLAATLLERTQGGRLETVDHAPGPARLTAREREIASMVAAGRSSKEVAAALVVSARTVDNHLQRIYAKLGVSSRSELTDALAQQ